MPEQVRIIHARQGSIKKKHMRILAIELSGAPGSMVCREDGRTVLSREWSGETRQSRPVFADLRESAAEVFAGSGVDCYGVGIGPGSFSGLRSAVAVTQALALPDGKPVVAVSSARALANSILEETGRGRVVVIGDARRQELWAGCFGRDDGVTRLIGEWTVASAGCFPEPITSPGTLWVSAEWGRLESTLRQTCPSGVELLEGARVPTASMVATLVETLYSRGLDGEPPVPIYVHPAVSVAPRFE